jgi:hypothetical protein
MHTYSGGSVPPVHAVSMVLKANNKSVIVETLHVHRLQHETAGWALQTMSFYVNTVSYAELTRLFK